MAKGGFINEMLASKNATSDMGFLWRYLYYMYVGLPLIVVYFSLYLYVSYVVISMIENLVGLGPGGYFSNFPAAKWLLLVVVNLGFTVALYHFKLLPILFAPVLFITRV